jgi:hypothetical protein
MAVIRNPHKQVEEGRGQGMTWRSSALAASSSPCSASSPLWLLRTRAAACQGVPVGGWCGPRTPQGNPSKYTGPSHKCARLRARSDARALLSIGPGARSESLEGRNGSGGHRAGRGQGMARLHRTSGFHGSDSAARLYLFTAPT